MNLQTTFVFVKTTQVSHSNSGRQLLGLTQSKSLIMRLGPGENYLWQSLCRVFFDNSMLRTEYGYVSLA